MHHVGLLTATIAATSIDMYHVIQVDVMIWVAKTRVVPNMVAVDRFTSGLHPTCTMYVGINHKGYQLLWRSWVCVLCDYKSFCTLIKDYAQYIATYIIARIASWAVYMVYTYTHRFDNHANVYSFHLRSCNKQNPQHTPPAGKQAS